MIKNKMIWKVVFAALFIVYFNSCSSISVFSPYAYEQATSLKVESLDIMDKATQEYTAYSEKVDELNTKLQKAYEYSKGRAHNEVSTKQWEILISPDRNLLGGFLNRWKTEGKLSEAFTANAKGIVSDAFDTIIELESGKIKPSDVNQ